MKAPIFMIWTLLFFWVGVPSALAQRIMHGQPEKPVELSVSEEVKAAKILVENYIKLKNEYSRCLSDKASISTCMCNHTKEYEDFSKAVFDFTNITEGRLIDNGIFYYHEQGTKKTFNFYAMSNIQSEFMKYCTYTVNKEYAPVKEFDTEPLRITKTEQIKIIHSLYRYNRKLIPAPISPICRAQSRKNKSCSCITIDKYEILSAKAERVLEEYPDWKERWLEYSLDGYEYGGSVSAYIRSYKELERHCRKK